MAAVELASTSLFSDANLVAYYKLENANDSKGANNLTNTGTVTFSAGMFNNGADFGSISSGKKLSVASNVGLSGNAYTFSMWVKVGTAPSSGNQLEFLNHQAIGGKDNEGFRYMNSAGTLQMLFHRVKNGTSDETLTVNQTLTTGTWYHLGHTWDGSTMRGYVNGSEIGNRASSGNGASGIGDDFSLSRTDGSGGGFMADDVAVFTRALTAAEILSIYTGPTAVGGGGMLLRGAGC